MLIILLLILSVHFQVKHELENKDLSMDVLARYDIKRQKVLHGLDLPIGGDGRPTPSGTGPYYTKIKVGTPPKEFYVYVDTGSNIPWLTCVDCKHCEKKGVMTPRVYYPSTSSSSKKVKCSDQFCTANFGGGIGGLLRSCRHSLRCPYSTRYADGSVSQGYFVRDLVEFDQLAGNLVTVPVHSTLRFGCGVHQSQFLAHEDAYDGIIGLGQSKTSMVSQLAARGYTKSMFAHCLDGLNGGIFVIGHVVQPKVKSTPLVPSKELYYVKMEGIEVTNKLQQTKVVFSTRNGVETMIDSGTTFAYLPPEIYKPLVELITANMTLEMYTVAEALCFSYDGSVDLEFPSVTLSFEGSLQLVVYPHDYLYQFQIGQQCLGWKSTEQQQAPKSIPVLGDMVMSDKLIVYDIEDQTIGWTAYDCSSTIGILDEQTKETHQVGAHHLYVEISRGPTSNSTSPDYKLNKGIIIGIILLILVIGTTLLFFTIKCLMAVRERWQQWRQQFSE